MNIADNFDDLADLPSEAPALADLEAEAEAAGAADPIARLEWERLSEEERKRAVRDGAAWRTGVKASAHRAGFATMAEYLDLANPLSERTWPMATEPDALIVNIDTYRASVRQRSRGSSPTSHTSVE